MLIVSGNCDKTFASSIARLLGIKICKTDIELSTSRESIIKISQSVRQKRVFIIQTSTQNVNNDLMNLLLVAYACRTSSAQEIIAVLPHLPYSRQSKMRKRGSIVVKLISKLFVQAGINHVITIDLQVKEIQGFFECPVDNLRSLPFLLHYVRKNIPDFKNAVVVSRSPTGIARSTSMSERLGVGIAVIHGKFPNNSEEIDDDGRNSPPPVDVQKRFIAHHVGSLPMIATKSSGAPVLIGNVKDKITFLVEICIDDSTLMDFIESATFLKNNGAKAVYILGTHAMFSAKYHESITNSKIDEFIVTNTIPIHVNSSKIKIVDIRDLLAESIRRIYFKETMSHLFHEVTMND
ncbi:PRPP synthase-associated protein 2 [Intoshia linei]|uniref:PRPP synthase-associated protein 2 n=1 Tax=Intoshia linei TaxID=1819745 RepID=A0A177BBS0_9BILA|nr:PRPP synthase-associated protein 2 [Intoshia linei]